FVRSGEKRGSRVGRCYGFERKGPQGSLSPSAKLWKKLSNAVGAARLPHVKGGGCDGRMAQENTSELEAGVSGDTYDGDLARISHFTRASIFFWSDSRVRLLGVMMRTVSSPAIVPAISGNFEP